LFFMMNSCSLRRFSVPAQEKPRGREREKPAQG
jgi:hypothetical protein